MVKVRDFLIVICLIWMQFDAALGDVQVYNREQDGNGARNISVNIHGANGGNICIDCQNQIQLDTGLDGGDIQPNAPDLERLLAPMPPITPFLYVQPQVKRYSGSMVLSPRTAPEDETMDTLTYEFSPPTLNKQNDDEPFQPLVFDDDEAETHTLNNDEDNNNQDNANNQ